MTEEPCALCNNELIYLETPEKLQCSICKNEFESNTKCSNGHVICNSCQALDTQDYIEQFCKNSCSKNPVNLAESLMNSSKIKMHGPEHHFLVPAVLLTAYYNTTGETTLLPKKIKIAKERSKKILPAFCGLYGACGAAIGTGMFLSIVLKCTPFSKTEWKLSGLMTSNSLKAIAEDEGPRCCKRVTYHSLETAITFVEEHLNVKLEDSRIKCSHNAKNKECIEDLCKYHSSASAA